MRIALDIDGPVADFNTEFLAFYNEEFGLNDRVEDATHYDYVSSPNMKITEGQVNLAFRLFTKDKLWVTIPPVDDISILIRLANMEWLDIIYITSRPKHVINQTMQWLFENGLTVGGILFVEKEKKAEVAKALKCDYAVEDHPLTCKLYSENDIKCFLWDMPFNRDVKGSNIIRVNNWQYIYNYLVKEHNGE